MSDSFTAALVALGLTDAEIASFIKGVDDYFLGISREAWYIDLQLAEVQKQHAAMQPKLANSQAIAAKLSRPWPDPAPPPPVPVITAEPLILRPVDTTVATIIPYASDQS
jgi:hypothetical protein